MENPAETAAYITELKDCIQQYQQELDEIQELNRPVTKNAPFVISFVGKFKTGKSSLINALLGKELLPTKATTCTSIVTRIFRGRRLRAWCCDGNHRDAIALDTAISTIQEYQVRDPAHPLEVIIEAPIPWLSYGVELRDTPGMDDSAQFGALETIAMNSLRDTDLCICVYDASSMISGKERERTRYIHERMSGNVVYIVNRINLLNNQAQLQEIEALSQTFFGGLTHFEQNVAGTGAFYTVCSAPNMVELSQFDTWLKNIVSGKRTLFKKLMEWLFQTMIMTPEKEAIRSSTFSGKLKYQRAQIRSAASLQLSVLKEVLTAQNRIHLEKREQLVEEGRLLGAAEAEKIRCELPGAIEELKSLQELESELGTCITELKNRHPLKWKSLCASATMACVINFFTSNWNRYCAAQKQSLIGTIDPAFIKEVINSMTFPGYTFVSRMFGLKKIDTTVSSTMEYIHELVLPVLEQKLKDSVHEVAVRTKQEKIAQASNTPTGIEDIISEIEDVQHTLNKYV